MPGRRTPRARRAQGGSAPGGPARRDRPGGAEGEIGADERDDDGDAAQRTGQEDGCQGEQQAQQGQDGHVLRPRRGDEPAARPQQGPPRRRREPPDRHVVRHRDRFDRVGRRGVQQRLATEPAVAATGGRPADRGHTCRQRTRHRPGLAHGGAGRLVQGTGPGTEPARTSVRAALPQRRLRHARQRPCRSLKRGWNVP